MSAAVEERLHAIRERGATAADTVWLLDLIDRLQAQTAEGTGRVDGWISIGEAANQVIAGMRIVNP
jgi:hypothetical protein